MAIYFCLLSRKQWKRPYHRFRNESLFLLYCRENADGLIYLRAEIFDGGAHSVDLDQRLRAWQEQAAKLKAGEITKEDYDRWRYHYPAFDDTSIRVPIPTEEPARSKRGRKPRAHSVG